MNVMCKLDNFKTRSSVTEMEESRWKQQSSTQEITWKYVHDTGRQASEFFSVG